MAVITIEIRGKYDAKPVLHDAQADVRALGQTATESDSKTGGFFKNLASTAGGFLAANVIGGITGQVGNLARGLVEGNSQFEVYQTQFGVLLGNATAAKDRLAQLADFGAKTPFELPELVQADKVLTAFGLHSGDTAQRFGVSGEQILTTIGDVSAGTGVQFNELAVTFGKFASGATGEAIARFQELGIATREQMAAWGLQFSKSGQLLTPAREAFTILEAHVRQKFGGMMDAQSKTFAGMISNLQDWWGATMRTIGQPLFEVLKDKLAALLIFLGSDQVKGAINGFAAFLADVVGRGVTIATDAITRAIEIGRSLFEVGRLLATGDFRGGMFGLLEDSPWINALFVARDAALGLWSVIQTGYGIVVGLVDRFNLAQPILVGVASVLGVLLANAAGTAVVALAGVVAAAATAAAPFVVLGTVVATLYAAWSQDWGGIRAVVNDAAVSVQRAIQGVVDGFARMLGLDPGAYAGTWSDTFHEIGAVVAATWSQIQIIGAEIRGMFAGDAMGFEAFGQTMADVFGPALGGRIAAFVATVVQVFAALPTLFAELRGMVAGEDEAFVAFGQTVADVFGPALGGRIATTVAGIVTTFQALRPLGAELQGMLAGDNEAFVAFGQTLADIFGPQLGGTIAHFVAGTMDVLGQLPVLVAPIAHSFLDRWTLIFQGVQAILPSIQAIILSVFGIVATFLEQHGAQIFGFVVGTWQRVQAILNSLIPPIFVVVQTIFGAVATFLQQHGAEITAFLGDAWNHVQVIITLALSIIQATIVPALQAIAGFIAAHGTQIVAVLSGAWGVIRNVVDGALTLVRGVLEIGLAAINGDWSRAWYVLQTTLQAVWANVQGIVSGAVTILQAILSTAWDAITAVASAAWSYLSGTIIGPAWATIQQIVVTALAVVSATIQGAWAQITATVAAAMGVVQATLQAAWASVVATVVGAWNAVTGTVASSVASVQATLAAAWNSVVATVASAWNTVTTLIVQAVASVQATLSAAWNAVVVSAQAAWTMLANSVIGQTLTNISTLVSGSAELIHAILRLAWQGMTAEAQAAWTGFRVGVIEPAWNSVVATVRTATDVVAATMRVAWDTITVAAHLAWQFVWAGVLVPAWNGITQTVRTASDTVTTTLTLAWAAMTQAASIAWNGLKDQVIIPVWNGLQAFIDGAKQTLETAIVQPFRNARDLIGGIWDTLRGTVEEKLNGARTWIEQQTTIVKDAVLGPFRNARDEIGGVWVTLRSNVETKLNETKHWIDDQRTSITDALLNPFRSARAAIGDVIAGFKDNILRPLQGALNGVNSFVNSFKLAINSVSQALISKPIITFPDLNLHIPGYARGTRDTHPGGPAIVDDGNGPLAGNELIVDAKRGAFMFRDAGPKMIDLAPGSSVLSAPNTTRLFSYLQRLGTDAAEVFGSMPRYAMGVGDVWNLLSGGVDSAVNTLLGGLTIDLPGVLSGLASGIVNKAVGMAKDWLTGAGGGGGGPLGSGAGGVFVPGSGLQNALRVMGIPGAVLTSTFSDSRGALGIHGGDDFATTRGRPFGPLFPGMARNVFSQVGGWASMVEGANGYQAYYGHQDQPGAVGPVSTGQTMGRVGMSGWATGPHIHFQLKRFGALIDPLTSYINLGGVGRSRALADGGWIQEPIVGRGLTTGTRYTLGEREDEAVIPRSKMGRDRDRPAIVIEHLHVGPDQSKAEIRAMMIDAAETALRHYDQSTSRTAGTRSLLRPR